LSPLRRALQIASALFIYLLCLPLALLPPKFGLKLGAVMGRVAFFLWRSRARVAIENIRLVQSKGYLQDYRPEDIARRAFENMGRSLVEIIKIYYGLGDSIVKGVQFQGLENYKNVQASGRPVIFITGHCGNWELLALATAYRIGRIYVMARRQNNPYINTMIERARTRYGNVVVYKKDGLRKVLKALRSGYPVGILMDQSVVRSEGLPVEFLGHEAWTLKSPVIITKKTGAALLPAFIKRQDTGHVVTIYPEVEISEGTSDEVLKQDLRRLNTFFEEYIIENPAEWLWIHRRWKKR
jgi:KDO2-lipid IV(A) lauroyltransferase